MNIDSIERLISMNTPGNYIFLKKGYIKMVAIPGFNAVILDRRLSSKARQRKTTSLVVKVSSSNDRYRAQ